VNFGGAIGRKVVSNIVAKNAEPEFGARRRGGAFGTKEGEPFTRNCWG